MNNHCDSCEHKQMPDGGHCYMFRAEPETPCAQHTNIALKTIALRKQIASRGFGYAITRPFGYKETP